MAFLFISPLNVFADQPGGNKDDVNIVVTCVEYIGDGKIRASFGYENTGKRDVRLKKSKSIVKYNYGQSQKNGPYLFKPGVTESAFSQEFDSKDRVQWTVTLSNGKVKTVDANINSNHCQGIEESLNIIPGYIPPEGGKQLDSRIGAELTSLYNAYIADPMAFSFVTDDIFQLDGDRVLIEVVAESGQYSALMTILNGMGFVTVTNNPPASHATGWIDIAVLLQLNAISELTYARPVYPGVTNYIVPATGLTKSQGDFAIHSDFVRLGYDLDGSEVKIGVLSNSFNSKMTAHIDVANGDLPGSGNPNGYELEVDVLQDISPASGTLSDEGRAMLQIIHDVAPGAELAFRTGFLGEQDMALGIRQLANAGCDVVVDDISYITEPFFRDGVVAQTIDSVVNEGVTFFSSAGNFGDYSYTNIFDGTTAPGTITGEAHDFSGSGDIFQGVLLPEGSYTLVLQWDDGTDPDMTTTQTDLDLFLSDDAGFSLLGFNRENVGTFPIEVVPFAVSGDDVNANVVIARASGPDVPVRFKYILFRGGSQFQMLEYNVPGSSTIVGHPNAEKAISVGAVRFDKNPIYSPGDYEMPVIMSFSSVGGTEVNGTPRAKPDITAPNGVNTTIDLGSGDWDDPIDPDVLYPNFFGTSAASPHAAGMAALLMEGKLKYDPGNPLDPENIRSLMKLTALDMGESGEDYVSGAGFIQAHKAMMTFANPNPYVENLILASESGTPGDSVRPFSFTITGDFFTDSTQVIFRGETLEEGVIIENENTISVDHPGFIGNPEVNAFNPVISPSELDGGFAGGISFSDPVKQNVIIQAGRVTKKYGEIMPEYTSSISLITQEDDTLSLEDAVLSGLVLPAEASRLSGLSYAVPASDTSGAGDYIIIPSLSPVFDAEMPSSEIDHSISEKYILEFVNGSLGIEKLALKITPQDVGIIYGEQLPPSGIEFLYEVGDSSVNIEDIGLVLSQVEQEHSGALSNEISLIRGVAIVNGIPLIRGIAVVNGVRMLRGIAVVNGVEVKVEVEGSDTTVYVAGEPILNGARLMRGVAIVNGLPFVNMTQIVRGIAVVNGDEVTFDDGYMTELNGVVLANKVRATRGVALVNRGGYSRGVAVVNGHEVVIENDVTTIDGVPVPTEGIVQINGINVIRGIAVVNSARISRGVAVVNGVDVPIENGLPSVRGIAIVNGIPMLRGIAIVNNLEVEVEDGEVSQVKEDGVVINASIRRGVAIVNDVALVNGTQLTRGLAVVNGIAIVNADGTGDDVVNLENMNFMASGIAIVNGKVPGVRGRAIVNGMESIDGHSLSIAAGTVQEDSSIIYEEAAIANGIALVNGLAYVRGIAVVNGDSLTNGNAVVNGSSINNGSNQGTIMVFDATDVGAPADDLSFTPMSFITGTSAGKHWIVPGTFLSNNFEITYGLGTLTVDQAVLNVTAENQLKIYNETDPVLSFNHSGLFSGDSITGELSRDEGEDVGEYGIRQGSLSAGEDYSVSYDSAVLTIGPAQLIIEARAENKIYDGSREALVELSDNSLPEDALDMSYSSALFDTKQVGEGKTVDVLGITIGGEKAGNYTANESASDTASISVRDIEIGLIAYDKEYDGNTAAISSAEVKAGLVEGDDVMAASNGGFFSTRNAGIGWLVTADVSISGDDAGNYLANLTATDTADITLKYLEIGLSAHDKVYDGDTIAITSAFVSIGKVEDDDVEVSSTEGGFSSKDVGTGILVTALVSAYGSDAANYITNISATDTASITPKALEIGLLAEDKIYDGTTEALTSAFLASGHLPGDEILVSSNSGVFASRNVGSGIMVTAMVSSSGPQAGNYTANVSASDTASISPKSFEIGIQGLSKVYDGTTDAMSTAFVVGSLVDGDDVTVSSSDGVFVSKDAGSGIELTALVSFLGADAGNYSSNLSASDTASITPKDLEIGISAESKTYNGNTDALTSAFVSSGLIVGDELSVSSRGGLFATKHVGSGIEVSAFVSSSGAHAANYLANATAVDTASIFPTALLIGITVEDKIYDGTRAAITSAFVNDGLVDGDDVSVSSSDGAFISKDAGTGILVTANVSSSGADAANYISNASAESLGDILPRDVTVSLEEPFLFIKEKDPLPAFAFSYMGWIDGEAGDESYTVFREGDNAAYNRYSYHSAGSYTVTPHASNPNYSFTSEEGMLHVNPYGWGAICIVPELSCIEKLADGYYMAKFEYRNYNSTAVYIPEGSNNYLSGDGIDWASSQALPTMFAPGGGSFVVFYDGSDISWKVRSYYGFLKVTKSVNSRYCHTRCDSYHKSAPGSDLEEDEVYDQIVAFPNPVVDWVSISMKDIEQYKMISIYDLAGKSYPLRSVDKRADYLDINMAQMPSGQYLIRIVMEDDVRIVQVIKH